MTDPARYDTIEVQRRVLGVVRTIVGERPIESASTWRSIGMDSLDLLTLVCGIEDEFELSIADPVAIRLRTVSDVVALIVSG
jgi:acyl carrier protein